MVVNETGGAAVVGVGATAFGALGRSADDLAGEALRTALEDAAVPADAVDGLLTHRVDSYERLAVEHPDEALLTHLRHCVHGLALVAHSQEFRAGGFVVVPDVVVYHLEMPAGYRRRDWTPGD